jgi:thiol:disulfide interchange protein
MKHILALAIAFFALTLTSFAQTPPTSAGDSIIMFDGSFKNMKLTAQKFKKPYFIVFGASWCAPCHAMRRDVFTNTAIAQFTNDHYLVYDLDLESFTGLEINNEFQVNQLPTIKFFDYTGKELETVTGLMDINYLYKKLRTNAGIPISRVYEQQETPVTPQE